MKKFNLLRKSERKSVGTTLALTVGSPSAHRRYSALKHLTFMLLFLLGSLNVWGDDFSETYSYGGSNWTRTGFTDEGTYYKSLSDGDCVATIPGIFTNKTITSAVTITLNVACYGNGDNPTSSKFSIYTSSACTTQVTASQGGTLPTDKNYKNTTYTVTQTNAANFSNDLSVKVASGTKLIRLMSITVGFSYTDAAPSYEITAVSNNDLWGTVSGTTTITAEPKAGYRVKAGNAGYTVTSGTAEVTNNGDNTFSVSTSVDCTVQINFEQIPSYTVTWNNHGLTSTSQVYEGEKPEFPATPTSCDATSTTFVGWATAAWDGKLADLVGKTVYTSAAEMPAVAGPVEYFAVYAKVSAGDEEEHDGPSFSRSGSDNTYTTGYTFSAQAEGKTGYYQDGSGTLRYIQVLNATTPIFSETPNRVTVTAKIGGGTGNTDLTDPVQAQLLDNTGAPITGAVVAITSHITTNTGDTYAEIEIPITGVTSAYGVRISHQKQSGYNVRYYSFSLKYYTGGATYSDYMTTCAAAGTCEAPSFSPAAGTFDVAQDITLQTSTPSAHIYYTLDGTDPDDGSAEYSTPIHITQNTTIKAITYADGLTESSISTGEFNIRYAQPTFSPAGGAYNAAQNVTISAAGADAIYYAIGETPTIDEEHKYTAPIAINTTGSHTINAIAVKAGYANSSVASATYVMDLPYANIAAFIAGKPTTAKSLTLNNAIITGVDETTLYIQDETAGIMIYGLASLPENAAPNHSISGTIVGKYSSYRHQHELVKPNNTTPIDITNVTISADEVARPAISEYTSLSAAYAEKPMMLVTLKGVNYDGTQYDFDGNKIYNTFGALTEKTMPETTVECDITGVVIDYNGTLELLPVFASDIVADADAAAPTVSPEGGADAENAVTAAAVEITAAANTKVNGLDATTIDINSTTPAEVTVTVTRDFYRSVNFSCGWYKAAAAKYDINGQGATTEGEVVAKVENVEAATAAEGDEVHVFITPNTHFHFATILVNDGAITTTEVSEGAEYSFTMPGEAVTIAVTWTEDAKATLTFAKGAADGGEAAPGNIVDYVGETVQLPANPFTYTGHKFIGWSCDGGTTKLAAGANYTLAEDKAFVAQWDEIPDFAHGDWILVEDVAELSEGSYVIIAAEKYDYAMIPYTSGNNCRREEAVKNGKLLTYNNAFAIFEIKNFVQEEVVTGKSFLDVASDKYLYSPSANNYLKTKEQQDAYAAWSIEISAGTLTAFNKGNTAYEIQYNTSGMFSCYKSTQQAISLYKYHVPSLKLSYDANAGGDVVTNLPGMQVADNEGKVTVSSETPLRENYIFNGWKDGESNDHAAGDVITLSANITLYAQWRTPETYSISYVANGGTLIEGESEITPNPTSVTEGNAYTIEENVYEVEGKLFLGWKANDVIYNAGQVIYPTEDMAFVAQWGDPMVTDFMLVTDVKQLKDGDKVYIVADGNYNMALGELNGSVRNPVEIAKQNNHIVNIGNNPVELTLGKSGDDYTFYDGANYLAWTSGNTLTNETSVTNNSTWTITISEGVTTIANKDDNTRKLQYNSSSPRFAAYTSAQKAVSIYKRPDYTRNVSGNYATICLPKAGKIDGASLYEIAYYGETSKKIFFDEIVNGEMEAGIPYIFLPAAGVEKINVYYSDNTAADAPASNRNGLYGFYDLNDPAATHNITQDAGYYILYNNQYWLVSGRAAYVENYRAYIELDQINPKESALAPGRRRISMSVNDTQTATGIESAEANEAPHKVLINGELFILRGEKMYNAKGQLVK